MKHKNPNLISTFQVNIDQNKEEAMESRKKQLAKQLARYQNLPLAQKICLSDRRIFQWYEKFRGKVYVAFSGGKDSTVLLHLVRKRFPDVPAVFCNTGLEYPEIVEFVKTIDNVIIIKPEMNFKKVIEKYGYPVISKMQAQYIDEYRNTKSEKLKKSRFEGALYKGVRSYKISEKWKYLINAPFRISAKCCNIMKKRPSAKYEKESKRVPYIGSMAVESFYRFKQYANDGCNAFNLNRPQSRPLMFWKEADIWEYIRKENIKYSKIYDVAGVNRTGCIFCMFGVQYDTHPNRFEILKMLHPQLYDYCMNKLELKKVLKFIGINMRG